MSEEKNNDVLPAMLSEGEVIIPNDLAEKYNAAVKSQEIKLENLQENSEVLENTESAVVEVAEKENVIASPKPSKNLEDVKPSVGVVNGAIGSVGANKKDKASKLNTEKVEKVAIHSTKNVTWSEVGKVYRGYNIVTKEQADKWLTRNHIRLATPAEVAKEFGK